MFLLFSKQNKSRIQLLGIIVVSVSILKGVIVKSELPDALALVVIKIVLIITANSTAKSPHESLHMEGHFARTEHDNFASGVCCFSTHFCGALLQTDTPGN